ncbi:hypothetical protein QR680_001232 [Steinernema hermaphroditum]|uniref:Sushi domain-containing protein n=1 Tax=Steinernema hermaphroditum TaxID=289476 RepID=A0AA39LFG8_9BILA|nr:hypothetical protein QR680_001232 [Steinernema hermaphroditum]
MVARLRFALTVSVFVFNCLISTVDSNNYKLAELYSYVNAHNGPFRDHYATTWTQASHPEALSGYSLLDTFGMIGVQSDSAYNTEIANCSCVQEIVQLFDQQVGIGSTPQNPGLFGRLDHKFARTGEESNMLFQKYERTGEKLYCVKNRNECGATVPLYQWYSASEIDTIYTTREVNDAAISNLIPQGVLCYIWPNEFKDKNCTHPVNQNPMLQIDAGAVGYGYSTEISNEEKTMKNCDLNKLEAAHGQWAMTKPEATPGTVAILNCDTGFVATENPTVVVCQRSGEWMPPTGKCRMSGCEGPVNWKAEYGEISFSMEKIRNPTDDTEVNIYPIGTTAMLVCDKTSDVIEREADIVYCSESGWAPRMLGRCYKVCPEFSVAKGHVEYSSVDGTGRLTNSNGTVATLICGSGAKLVGSGTATCKNGEWDKEDIGKCEPVGCAPLAEVTDGKLEYATESGHLHTEPLKFYESGTRVHLICENETKMKGGHEAVCQCNEEWKPEIGNCS